MPGSTGNAPWPRPLELTLRLGLGMAAALWLAHQYGTLVAEASLPLIGWTFSWMDDHFRLIGVDIAAEGADTAIRLRASLARPLVLGGQVLIPNPAGWARVTTTVGTLLQPFVILFGLLPAWPAKGLGDWGLRLFLLPFVALVLLLVNVPPTLLGYLWDMHVRDFEPGRFSPLLIWLNFLNGGGRLVLGLGGIALILSAGTLVTRTRRWLRPSRDSMTASSPFGLLE